MIVPKPPLSTPTTFLGLRVSRTSNRLAPWPAHQPQQHRTYSLATVCSTSSHILPANGVLTASPTHHRLRANPSARPPFARRPIHATGHLRRQHFPDPATQTHYQALQLTPRATPAEVKKSFYALSKRFHPDRNRNDPQAASSARFQRISEAYSVLSVPAKRAAYDRDVLHLHTQTHSHAGAPTSNSPYSSNPPAGSSAVYRGRAASYHSTGTRSTTRKRTAFRPSPYATRKTWHNPSTPHHESADANASGDPAAAGGPTVNGGYGHGGMGPGHDPFHHTRAQKPQHFNRAQHEQTQQRYEAHHQKQQQQQQQQQQKKTHHPSQPQHPLFATSTASGHASSTGRGQEFDPEPEVPPISSTGHFFVVSAILLSTVFIPLLFH